jgi:hypothetical protein
MTDLLAIYRPWLRYDSQESYSCDSPAVLTDAFTNGRTNSLKRANGSVIATADHGLGLEFLDGAHYVDGAAVRQDDFLDEAGRDYVADARRMHAVAGLGDRVCAHVATDGNGRRWLQYWFFYYYNDKSFLGLGLHEGDWEMIQIGLDDNERPDVATFAQHSSGERCLWSDLELKDGAPIVYVARGSHASHVHKGKYDAPVVPDYNDARGRLVRPDLIEIDDDFPSWASWPGFWGSTRSHSIVESSSPRGPRQHGQWADPAAFHARATPTRAVTSQAQRVRTVQGPAPPAIAARRQDDKAYVDYVAAPGTAKLVATIDAPDDKLPPYTCTVEVTDLKGTHEFPITLGPGAYAVAVSAYDADGHGSAPAQATVPAKR